MVSHVLLQVLDIAMTLFIAKTDSPLCSAQSGLTRAMTDAEDCVVHLKVVKLYNFI